MANQITTFLDNLIGSKLGIRGKLIIIFVIIKVIPLLGLAWIAWHGVQVLSTESSKKMSERALITSQQTQKLGETVVQDSISALDNRSREEMERLTTDTARTIARFLYERDSDLRYATSLPLNQDTFSQFVNKRTRKVIVSDNWTFDEKTKQWIDQDPPKFDKNLVIPNATNSENRKAFHSRPPEPMPKWTNKPLFLEMTYFDLNGQEKIKAVTDEKLLSKELRNVSKRENTFVKAENYFEQAQNLKEGEIFVSDVIGEYVPSKIIGPLTPEKAKKAGIEFKPEEEGFAGRENPVGKKFRGLVRWITPVFKNGQKVGYMSLALDHAHIMNFTETLMPTEQRYTHIADATNGNYAFIWDYKGRSIAHPRHHSIVGFNAQTGEPQTPWLEKSIYDAWKKSNLPLQQFLADKTPFNNQSLKKKPAKELNKEGLVGLDCRYLDFAPQCDGWYEVTQHGGSGSFVILWTGVWKLTTAAAIPYYTGNYANSKRGFGFVTIGANIDEFQKPALITKKKIEAQIQANQQEMVVAQKKIQELMMDLLHETASQLSASTVIMLIVVIFIAIWMANSLTQKIKYIVDGLKRFESGDLDYRLEHKSNDELGQLVDSFNKMALSIQNSFETVEKARRDAEELSRLKTNFIESMSHEFRTPLNGILGFSEMLKDELEDEMQLESATIIYRNSKQLLSLVDTILDLAKIEAGQMKLLYKSNDFNVIIKKLKPFVEDWLQESEKTLDFSIELPENMPKIMFDQTRLLQIIGHLVHNSIKFTEEGFVKLSVDLDNNNKYYVIKIIDSGIGIASEHHELIFQKFRQLSAFSTRKQGGAGLGLALVKEYVTLMNGEITFESEANKGTIFTITLPLLEEVVK